MPRFSSIYWRAKHQRALRTPALDRPAVWLDGADRSTIIIDTGVSQWRDKSGNGRHMTAPGTRPTLAANSLNGLNTIAFDNRTTTQTLTNAYSYSGTDITLVSLAYSLRGTFQERTAYPRLWSMNATGQQDYNNNSGFIMVYSVGAALNNAATLRTNSILAQSTINSNAQWAFHVGTKSGGSGTFSTNGEARVSGSTSNSALGFNVIRIGNDVAGIDSGLFGNVAEAMIFSYALNLSQQQKVEGYLAHKWGLTANLPAAHPFKNRPPLIGD
jgi:hypothetical protein